jgi:hypothetical protein
VETDRLPSLALRRHNESALGLTWRDDWENPYEGPITLLWKLIVANVVTPTELFRLLEIQKPVDLSGRLFFDISHSLRKKFPLDRAYFPPLGNVRLSLHHDHPSAVHQRLRYCVPCLTKGYQSSLHQLSALRHCPIHGTPIYGTCRGCNAPTPFYGLDPVSLASPFCCPHCAAPYGAKIWSLLPLDGLNEVHDGGFEQLRAIHRWIVEINAMAPAKSWLTDRPSYGAVPGSAVRLALLAYVSNTVVPTPCLRDPPLYLRECIVRASSAESPSKGQAHDDSRNKIYIRIRRCIRRRLLRRHDIRQTDLHVASNDDWDWDFLSQSFMPKHPLTKPNTLAFQWWRNHFEWTDPRVGLGWSKLRSQPIICRPPSNEEAAFLDQPNVLAWYFLASFRVYQKLAHDWHDQMRVYYPRLDAGSVLTQLNRLWPSYAERISSGKTGLPPPVMLAAVDADVPYADVRTIRFLVHSTQIDESIDL